MTALARKSASKSVYQMTDAELRAMYPGFEGIVIDHPSQAAQYRCTTILHEYVDSGCPKAFVSWCRAQKSLSFDGFKAVWRAYEIYCYETGQTPLMQGQFQREFSRLARRSRPSKLKRGQKRPTVYHIKRSG